MITQKCGGLCLLILGNDFTFDSSLYQTLEDLTIKFGIAMKSFKVPTAVENRF